MIDPTNSILHTASVHIIGNKSIEQPLRLSRTPLILEDELLKRSLLTYFLSNFSTPEYFSFTFSNQDFTLNPLFRFCSGIFDDVDSFHENSVEIAQYLYASTNHPNIKSGDLFIARISGIVLDNKSVDGVGIFKSENKDTFLQLGTATPEFDIFAEEGINIRKLDKGCLVLNVEREAGYKVLIVDNANKSEAQFWKNDFLNVTPWSDAFHHTHNFMNLTRQYVGDQLEEEFSVSKADKIDLLNRSMNFFKSKEQFNQNEFESEVLEDASVIESFRKYEKTFMTDAEIADNFEISAHAVKLQARVFKTVLKLDKNFHIYIHGNRELIEKGYDEVSRRHYYKLYFDQET